MTLAGWSGIIVRVPCITIYLILTRSDILTKLMSMDRAVKGKNKDPMLHGKQQREPGFLRKHVGWKHSLINVKVHGSEKDLFHMVRHTPFWDH